MASAREVRAAVRAQHAQQVKGRQDAALSVAAAWDTIEKARDRLTAAERRASATVTAATEQLPLPDLAALAGVPIAELRRLVRAGKQTSAPEPPCGDPDPPVPPQTVVGRVPTDGAAGRARRPHSRIRPSAP